MIRFLRRLANFADYHLIRAPRGGGKPVPVAALNEEYRSGRWDHFAAPAEQPRYDRLCALILAGRPAPSVLDLGCGSGRLEALLEQHGVTDLTGVDLSPEGLARAAALQLAAARFTEGNLEIWRPDRSHDVIVFNECIGYLRKPAETVRDFARHLAPGGVIVVSLFRWGNHRAIWRAIERQLAVASAEVLQNPRGQTWDIKVLKPRT